MAASSSAMRTSAMSLHRRLGSFCTHRPSTWRMCAGVSAGSALQSGDRSRIATIVSETVSPANAVHRRSSRRGRSRTPRCRRSCRQGSRGSARGSCMRASRRSGCLERRSRNGRQMRQIASAVRVARGHRQPEIEHLDLAVCSELDDWPASDRDGRCPCRVRCRVHRQSARRSPALHRAGASAAPERGRRSVGPRPAPSQSPATPPASSRP